MEIINGYTLYEPLQNKDAGFSRWTFAKKSETDYFLKEFMNPVYPCDDSIGDELMSMRINDCVKYEKDKINLYTAINEVSDGNLIRINEFFRCQSHYYISTPKVMCESISFNEISKLDFSIKLMLCKSIAHSIMKLHSVNIVHADLKDNNIMIQKNTNGNYIGKIIDFDCSFFESEPPQYEDDLGGDQVYMSPEACLFLYGEEVKLTCKMDVFALGLLFHQYFTGELPGFDHNEYDYAYEAVLDGGQLTVSDDIPEDIREMIRKMLICDSDERISSRDTFLELATYDGMLYRDYSEEYVDESQDIVPPTTVLTEFTVSKYIGDDAVETEEYGELHKNVDTVQKKSFFKAAGDL